MYDVAVIGGGAAGMMAAITAAKRGKSVLLLEKNEKLGKKLYITGKGRCNVTNVREPGEFIREVVTNPRFLMSAINTFKPTDTVDFFENAGCPIKIERGERAFPESDKSSDIISALSSEMVNSGVNIRYNMKVSAIENTSDFYKISTDNSGFEAKSVIIATGGVSYPLTGSTGDGYKFAMAFGHKTVTAKPALCPIILKSAYNASGKTVPRVKLPFPEGLSLKNVSASVVNGSDKELCSEFGEMLFTDRGVSGPIVLTLSSKICSKPVEGLKFVIDFKPALDDETLDARILRDFSEVKNKFFKNALDGLLPKSLIPYVIALSGISENTAVNSIKKEQRLSLLRLIKGMTFEIESLAPIEEAIITSGGVDVNAVNPKTMESKLSKGLYFAGEVLDVDALTGGYNIQIALSTGYAAGTYA